MRSFRAILVEPILAVAFVAGLISCTNTVSYVGALESIPVPQQALMKRLPKPNCLAQPRGSGSGTGATANSSTSVKAEDVSKARQKPAEERSAPVVKPTPEGETKQSGKDESQAKPTASDSEKREKVAAKKSVSQSSATIETIKKLATIETLRKQLDCYKRAERKARIRLYRLQTSTADMVSAVEKAKRE